MNPIWDTNYYYAPYVDDGQWEQFMSGMGAWLGAGAADLAEDQTNFHTGGLGQALGEKAGDALGSGLGWTLDNLTTLQQNFQALMDQINDWRTYTTPLDNPATNPFQ